MDIEESHHLLQPLTNPSTAATAAATAAQEDQDPSHVKLIASNSAIIFRLSLVVFIGIISIWANHEASKGFAITIVNEAGGDRLPGKRFQVFYVSNNEATRTLIKASKIVENFLYPDDDGSTKKPIGRVILKLTGREMIDKFVFDSGVDHEFVLNISPSIMEGTNFRHAMFVAVLQGMSRIWLWDGQGKVPKNLINDIVRCMTNYLVPNFNNVEQSEFSTSTTSATTCWKRGDSREVAEFLNFCERRRPGFIRRLNQAMKDDGWHDSKLDVALDMSVQNLCTTYDSLRYNFSSV